MKIDWSTAIILKSLSFICGNCNSDISSEKGFNGIFQEKNSRGQNIAHPVQIYICHKCTMPTFICSIKGIKIPGNTFGKRVEHITDEAVESLYEEARKCMKINSYTAAVLCCRKLLMQIAVSKGAEPGKPFFQYVEYFKENNFIPPGSEDWVDHIRKKGNEANHEIKIMELEDAEDLINFIEMLLKIIFEFPAITKKN